MDVKICGLCRPADGRAAAAAGARYAGVVLAPGGRRSRSVEEAEAIYAAADGVRRVGVFVDERRDGLLRVAERLRLDVLQLHGGESPSLVYRMRGRGFAVWKALRPRTREEFLAGIEAYGDVVDGLLLDGWSARAAGGTATRFSWEMVASLRARVPEGVRLIVAGGLDAVNVGRAVALLRPDVVDVSSGVEVRVGEKSAGAIVAFIEAAARSAGAEARSVAMDPGGES